MAQYLGEVNGYYSFLLFIKMESELVAGFQTEHSALSFAYFFLGEYGNIILICTITANLFLGGYSIFGINSGIILGVKVSILLFVFIWVRATLPRMRFDQLMTLMWTRLLPLVLGYFVLISSIMVVI